MKKLFLPGSFSEKDSGGRQIYRVMNLTTGFLLFSCFCAFSSNVNSQNSKVNLKKQNTTLEHVLDEIESQTGYLFISNRDINLNKSVSIKAKDASVKEVLEEVLKNTGLTYSIEGVNIILTKKNVETASQAAQQQKRIVKGIVKDLKGEPVIGANVVEKGSTNGTVTDVDGNFELSVGDKAILTFSYIGYNPQEVKVGKQTSLSIELSEDTKALDEVVVVGYGIQKKASLTGSLSTISAKAINDRPVVNVSNLLNGLAPGLSVVSSTGVPGQSSSINIRGIGTFNSSSPLYVIDGVIRDQAAMDALDPISISDITVLKDAASAAVYGSRAGNGVILINTKQGTVQAPQFTFRANYTTESRTVKTKMMDAYENGLFINDMILNMNNFDADKTKLDPRYVTPNELDHLKGHDYNWLEYAWRDPNMQNYNMSVNGGSKDIKYFLGAGYVKNNGIFKGVDSDKFSFQGNTTAQIAKNLTATVNISAHVRNVNVATWRFSDGSDLGDTYRCLNEWGGPWMPPYIDGVPTYGGYANIIEAMNNNYNRNKDNALNGIISLTYKLPWVEGLSVKGSYSYNYMQTQNKQFTKPTTSYVFQGGGDHGYIYDSNSTVVNTVTFAPKGTSRVTEGTVNNLYEQYNLQLDYLRSFGKHSVNGAFVIEQATSKYKNLSGYKNNLITTAIDELFVGSSESSQTGFSGTTSSTARLSYIGKFGYSFDNKYLLDVSFRADGSYIFPKNNRWGFFPSVSAGWIMSEESFFKKKDNFIDYLKFRASYGLLGNDAVNPYQWQANYSAKNGPYFKNATSSIVYGVLPNKNITWEKTSTLNLGFDTRFFSNAFDFSFDYFSRLTTDMLYSRIETIPGTFGARLPNENYGKVENKGFEISLGYNGSVSNKVRYYVKANLGYAKDKVKYLDVAANLPEHLNPIGKRLSTIKGYVYDGIIRNEEDKANKLPLQGYAPVLGIITYKDLYGPNGSEPDGIVNGNDQVIISENARPLFNYGLSIGAVWNNFSIDILFQGLGGWDKIYGPSVGIINGNNYAMWNDRWSVDNPNGTFPRAWYVDPTSNQRSTFWMKDASFLRLKNVNIAYNIPANVDFIKKIGLKGGKLFVNGSNLLLIFNKMKYMDPELADFGSYPLMRDITAGIEITF